MKKRTRGKISKADKERVIEALRKYLRWGNTGRYAVAKAFYEVFGDKEPPIKMNLSTVVRYCKKALAKAQAAPEKAPQPHQPESPPVKPTQLPARDVEKKYPRVTVRFCPHCGLDLRPFQAAASLVGMGMELKP